MAPVIIYSGPSAAGRLGDRRPILARAMSDFFVWFCDRGSCQNVAHPPKTLPAQGGTMKASTSVHLRLPTGKKQAVNKPPVLEGSKEPKPSAKGPQGRSPPAPKEPPLKKDAGKPTQHPKLVGKKLCWTEENETKAAACPEGNAKQKNSKSLMGPAQVSGGHGPQSLSVPEKQLLRPPNTAMRAARCGLLHAPHVNAKGDQPGMPAKAASGVVKTSSTAVLKKSKKLHNQALLSKGCVRTVATHGDMEHKKNAIPKTIKAKLFSLVDLELGDLIEIFRLAYQHWAIYVGNGYVIHLAPPSELAGAGCASLMSTLTNKALVKKERLMEVVGHDRYRVNNKHDCKYTPLPVNKIVRLAEEKVGQELEYKITSENCEHFVTELRYGVARSDQVRDFFVGATIAGLAGLFVGVGTAMVRRKKQQNQ
ncbi:uncharacterized protein LOC116520246 isoform X1 [Thamnophis elegans]|uniref:uncharacterized protein LOC116520246 isoform X1 n=2 Tax=Thamnophis elegans TaxID=35005 RepID=UPI0013788F9D|nr:uncharacterized protein LOC116520246 isoform X1 [Thamnophis elegans]